MTKVLMSLGDFEFEIGKNAFSTLERSRTYRVIESDVYGGSSLQHTGRAADSITLDAVIYPVWIEEGNLESLKKIKSTADKAEPLILLSSGGENFGRYLIEKIDESWVNLTETGIPEKIELKISLREFQGYREKQKEKVKPERKKR